MKEKIYKMTKYSSVTSDDMVWICTHLLDNPTVANYDEEEDLYFCIDCYIKNKTTDEKIGMVIIAKRKLKN